MAQRRCKMKGMMSAAKPESAGHRAGGEKTRPRHYNDDDEKTCPTQKSGQKGRFRRYRPSDGGERVGRPEGRERSAIGGAEGGERAQRYSRFVEVDRGERERPVQAKGKEKPARAWGGEKAGRAEGGERSARVNGKEKRAKVERAEKSGGIQAIAQKPDRDRKSVRGGKLNEAYHLKGNERAESDTEAEEISDDEDDDAPTRIENYFRLCGDGCRLPVKELSRSIKFVRRPIVVEDYDSLDDSEDKYDKGPLGKVITSGQGDNDPNRNTLSRSRKTSFLILLIVSLTASIMLLIYLTFPELSNEDKAKLKIPTTVDEAKALGQLLLKYKDNFSISKKFNF
ncbi:uncharacterized protein LOC127542860 [Antechinus flavipes]|uniref:uncharacterized protein LOC127542860 n=1 Tax=Antechinus flavipes TaxID=38775 RepID=UPI0022365262|nr:uncharacterized protein LOC127542860 [Antechinus flavipes]